MFKAFSSYLDRMTTLGAFNNQLIRFFEELVESYPEEKEIRYGLEALQGAKKINPKLILDLFYEHVYMPAHVAIEAEDHESVIRYAKTKIQNEFNEMSAALIIFDRHWDSMTTANQSAIWKYLKVLCVLCARAKGLPAKPA